MNIKQILKNFFFHYFLIYGMTVIVTFFWCLAAGDSSIPLDYFWKIMIYMKNLLAVIKVLIILKRLIMN